MKKLLTLAVILSICLLPLTAQVKLYKENSARPYKMQNSAESRIVTWLEDAEVEVIPAGQFAVIEGSFKDGVFVKGRDVALHGYTMCKYEVTQELYQLVTGTNPSFFKVDAAKGEDKMKRPVENVSWYDAVIFCNQLTCLVMNESDCVYTISNIKQLRDMGIKIALDDFGTGYTSIKQLMMLPINILKVDKSLVDNVEKGEVNRDFINSIGTMGHLLDCKVILEGVETDSQLEYIKNLDCDYVQGYVWGKPMSYSSAKDLIG